MRPPARGDLAGEIHSAKADLFAPCALGGILNAETIPRLRVKIVAGAANNQLREPADGDRLHGERSSTLPTTWPTPAA